MMYNILESKTEIKDGQLVKVTVLVKISEGDVRAIYVDTIPKSGYMYLTNQVLSNALLQEVAGWGVEIDGKDDIFPGWQARLVELHKGNV